MTDKSMRHFDYEIGKDIFSSEQEKINESIMNYQKTFESDPVFPEMDLISFPEHHHHHLENNVKSSEFVQDSQYMDLTAT